MHVDTDFLRSIRGPQNRWRRSPYDKVAVLVVIQIEHAVWLDVCRCRCELIMQRFQRRRADRFLAPSAIASAVPAEVLPVRIKGEIPEIQMRVTAMRAVHAIEFPVFLGSA